MTHTTPVSTWKLIYNRFKPKEEALREALCTLGNGYFGTRGAGLGSTASKIHYPGTYIAGVYNKLATYIAKRTIYNEDFVNCPNWLHISFKIGNGEWVYHPQCRYLSFHQELDMQEGILYRRIRIEDRQGRISLIESRVMVSIADPHCGAVRYCITPENYSGYITLRTRLDGSVENSGVVRYRQLNKKHLKLCSMRSVDKNCISLSVKTSQSDIHIAEAERVRIFSYGKAVRRVTRTAVKGNKRISQHFKLRVTKGHTYELEKICCIYTSKDKEINNYLAAATRSVQSAPDFTTLFRIHRQTWQFLWKKYDIRIEGNDFTQQVLRLHIFHLLQTASVHNVNIDSAMPARGLHGEAYRGHVFWDEMFVMPLFDFHSRKISRSLLMYRYRRLSKAKRSAKRNSYRGAMFPWQSGSTGEEETQTVHLNPLSGRWGPDYSRIQRHVSFAIAYNIWKFWERSGDNDFMFRYGAEMFLLIAQFAASLSVLNTHDGRYHTDGIMGPDEFHEHFPGSSKPGLRDNAYSNIFIVWIIRRAIELLSRLPEGHKKRICKKIGCHAPELRRWNAITRKMNIVMKREIISQFDGYLKLKEIDFKKYKEKYGSVERMDRILKAEGKSPNDYKVAKQADVLMMFYLFPLGEMKEVFRRLGYNMNTKIIHKNYDYYINRTSHGSTLSKVVHCYLAHMLGRSTEAWDWFQEVLRSDILDTQGGTTPEGIHCGVMGGSVNIVVAGFAGVNVMRDRVRINPKLPEKIQSIQLRFRYKRSRIALSVNKKHIAVFVHGFRSGQVAVPIEIAGKLYNVPYGKTHNVTYRS